MLRDLTDFRVVKITTLKSSKSLIISVLWVAPLRSAVLPSLKSGGSTLESGYPTQESCYPTSEGAPVTEFGSFYHCICATPPLRVLLPPNPKCHTGTRVVPHQESELFHLRNRSIPPLNPARNLKSRGEFTASRQI